MARTHDSPRIGSRIRALRNAAGLTQAEVAEAVRVAPETMSRIERGRLAPSTALVARLASAVGVEAGAFFSSAPTQPRAPTLRPAERRLLVLVRDLPDALVEDVIRGVRLLVGVGRQSTRSDARRSNPSDQGRRGP